MKNLKCKICKKEITHGSKSGLCKSCSHKGKKKPPFTKEHKEKMSQAKKGKPSNMFGKKHTKKSRMKMSKSKIGHETSEETRNKISKAKKGKKRKPFTKKHRDNISKANTIHGQSKLPYSTEFTQSLRNEIKERDNFKCQGCGMTQAEHLEEYNRSLEIHHIDHCSFNNNKNNLITTCKQCNMKANVNSTRDYWFAYYTYKIEVSNG